MSEGINIQGSPGAPVSITAATEEPRPRGRSASLTIAAVGDFHWSTEADARWVREIASEAAEVADVLALLGDLTTHGTAAQMAAFGRVFAGLGRPVLAVLGNHDWHVNRRDELVAVLQEGGIDVLERDHRVLELCGAEVGIAGCKGFGGGFDGAHIPDFGEPLMRAVYAESMAEAEALDEALRAIALCPFRIALLHYAPLTATLRGERSDIWPFLGTDRLAAPLREHNPDLVLHGHAHAGTFEGALGEVPVYNVSVPVLGEDFWVFEMTGVRRMPSEVH
jgi:Icc-related predicted phosphoesterase